MASERPFCTKDSVTIALKEIPKGGKVWFGKNSTSLGEKQVVSDLQSFSHWTLNIQFSLGKCMRVSEMATSPSSPPLAVAGSHHGLWGCL